MNSRSGLNLLFLVSLGILFSVYVSYLSYLDEAITLIAIVLGCMAIGSTLVASFSQMMIFVLGLYSIVTLLISAYQINMLEVFLSALIMFKFFAVLFTIEHVIKNKTRVLAFAFVALILSILGLAVNIAIPTVYNNFFDIREFDRGGMTRYAGAFLNPNLSGIVLVGSTMICTELIRCLHKYRIFILVLLILIASFIFASRTTQIFIIFLMILPYLTRRDKYMRVIPVIFILFCFSIFTFYFSPTSQTTIANINMLNQSHDANVRVLIILSGINLAIENFPFGAGFGTFASKADVGMKLFRDLGIDQHYAIKSQRGLHDSSVAVILGQIGAIGLLMYLYVIKLTLLKQPEFKHCANTVVIFVFLLGLITPFFFSAIMALVVMLSIKITLQKRDYEKGN